MNSPKTNKSSAGFLLRLVGILLTAAVLLVCGAAFLPGLAGCSAFAVLSGSMEPAIPVGSLVYVRPAEGAQLQAGDVVTFRLNGSVVTHRVAENDTAAGLLTTKGDANEAPDVQKTAYEHLIGRVILHLPLLGYAAAALSGLWGKVFAFVLAALGLVLQEAGSRRERPGGR